MGPTPAASRLGFRLMRFNLVVSTNTAGLRGWQRNGFPVVGTLPGAFHHRQRGDVDALVVDALVRIQSLIEEPPGLQDLPPLPASPGA